VPGTLAGGPVIVDDPAQGGEEVGRAMDLVDHDELARLGAEEGVGIGETPAVRGALQIEVHRSRAPRGGKLPSERRLPDLARADQDHRRHVPEAILDDSGDPARDQHNTGNLS
jgi:hypothetical protein